MNSKKAKTPDTNRAENDFFDKKRWDNYGRLFDEAIGNFVIGSERLLDALNNEGKNQTKK